MVVTVSGGNLLASHRWRSGVVTKNCNAQDTLTVKSFLAPSSAGPEEAEKPDLCILRVRKEFKNTVLSLSSFALLYEGKQTYSLLSVWYAPSTFEGTLYM